MPSGKRDRTTVTVSRETHTALLSIAETQRWKVGDAVAVALYLLDQASDEERRQAAYAMDCKQALERHLMNGGS